MIVLILSKVRPGFKGKLTRYLIQPHTGVYVGHASARIREILWKQVEDEVFDSDGSAIMIHPNQSEQGYSIRVTGDPKRIVRDFDGLLLPKKPKAG